MTTIRNAATIATAILAAAVAQPVSAKLGRFQSGKRSA